MLYSIYGAYPDFPNGGTWSDTVEVENYIDADATGRREMSKNLIDRNYYESDEEYEEDLDALDHEHTIIDCAPTDMKTHHAHELHKRLVALVHESDYDSDGNCYTCGAVIGGEGGEQDNTRCINPACDMLKAHSVLDAIAAHAKDVFVVVPVPDLLVFLELATPAPYSDTKPETAHAAEWRSSAFTECLCGKDASAYSRDGVQWAQITGAPISAVTCPGCLSAIEKRKEGGS